MRSHFSLTGAQHGLIMAAATLLAGGLDYLYNVLTGRWLDPVEFGVLVSVTALLQVAVHLTNVIRNIVAYYTADLSSRPGSQPQTGPFVRQAWRWSWRWGLVATLAAALLSPLAAPLLQLDTPRPLWAASLTLLLLFLRPVTDGALQGLQRFTGLAAVQVTQALLRLLLAALLIWQGWQAFGALLALPLASTLALLLALVWLRPQFRAGRSPLHQVVSWRYSAQTLAGLLAFALLINLDAIVVKLAFDPLTAGNYGPVVTLGKMNLFVPLAIGMVLFPKATQRQASGRDPRPVLLLALLVTLLPGLTLTTLYFLWPGPIVHTIFGDAYQNPGLVLGLIGLATTLFAALNIWLNYALSLQRPAFVAALVTVVAAQLIGLTLFHDSLTAIAAVTVAAGLAGNTAALLTLLHHH
jgi:O-antigen/teichoic acid export membrane protein